MAVLLLAGIVVLSLALAVAGAGALLWSVLSMMEVLQRHTAAPRSHDAPIQDTPLTERLAA